MKKMVLCSLLLMFIISASGCSNRVWDREQVSPEQKIVIKFSHVVAENTPKGMAAQRFAREVQERTDGRVEVQVFPNSSLYADGEEMQALQDGAVQIIAPATSKLGGLFPYWQVMDLPFAFQDTNAVHQALDGSIGQELTESLENQGFIALAFWDNGFKQLTNNMRPIVTPGDLQGLRFRVMMNSSVLQEQFRMLGARTIPLPFNDVYRYLEKNQLIGQENTISNIYSKKFYQVQKYMTITNHGYLGYVVLANKDYWDSLPQDIQDILNEVIAEVTVWEHEAAAELNELYFNALQEKDNVEITILTPEERKLWDEAFRPLYNYFGRRVSVDLMHEILQQKEQSKLTTGGET